jgi:hypothetical protein
MALKGIDATKKINAAKPKAKSITLAKLRP